MLGLSATLAACGGGNTSTPSDATANAGQHFSPPAETPTPRAVVHYRVLTLDPSDIALVALQDGSADWRPIHPSSLVADSAGLVVADYQLPLTAADLRYGVIVICNSGGRFRGDLIQTKGDVLTKRTLSCITGLPPLTGSVSNTAPTGVTVYLGEESATPPVGLADYTIAPPPIPGRHTLVARDHLNPRRFYIDRNVAITSDSATLPPIDFAYALAADPSRYTLSIRELPNPDFRCELKPELRLGSTFADLSLGVIRYPTGGEAAVDWQPVNQSQRQPDDRFRLRSICGHIGDPADRTDERGFVAYQTSPSDVAMPLPSAVPAPSLSMDGQRLRIGFHPYSPLRLGLAVHTYHLHLDDRISAERGSWDIRVDQAWLNSRTEYTFPDLTGLSGWDSRFYPVARDSAAYVYGTDHVTNFTAYASEGLNIWNLIEGYNNGLTPTAEGTVYWARHLLR